MFRNGASSSSNGRVAAMRRSALLFAVLFVTLGSATEVQGLDSSRYLTQYAHRIYQSPRRGIIYSITQTHDGFVWLGTQAGLQRFDGLSFARAAEVIGNFPETGAVVAVREDTQGNLWAGTSDDGLLRVDSHGRVTRWTEKDGLPDNKVRCLVAGVNGGMWACSGNSIAQMVGGKIQVLGRDQGWVAGTSRAACLAQDGTLWVSGDTATILTWDGKRFQPREIHSLPTGGAIRAMLCLGDAVWLGTSKGLIRIRGNEERLFREQETLDGRRNRFARIWTRRNDLRGHNGRHQPVARGRI